MSVGVPDVAFHIGLCETWNEPGPRVEARALPQKDGICRLLSLTAEALERRG